MKKCLGECGKTLPETNEFFHNKGKTFYPYCKKCRSKKDHQYRETNKKEINKQRKEYRSSVENKKHKQEYDIKYREENRNKISERIKQYRSKLKNKVRRNKNERARRRNDISYHIKSVISGSINKCIKRNSGSKNGSSIWKYLLYSPQQLKDHLESLFEPWMNWDNYGAGEGKWNIDHIIPQNKLPFDSLDHPNFLKCWTLENLRPLDAIENIRKGSKII